MEKKFFRDRYSIISFIIILMVFVISYKLFALQIVKGQYYKQESEKRMLRVNTVEASRGEILDKFGKVLANNLPAFTVEITKTKIDDVSLNKSLFELVKVFEKNKDIYKDNLPIIVPYKFIFNTPKEEEVWKKKYKISLNADSKQSFEELRKKYKIDNTLNEVDARKIMTLRYEMSEQGYQSFKSVVLAFDISKQAVSEIEERNLEFPGINIVVNPIRNYPNGDLASHLLGYVGKINQSELKKFSNNGYDQNDIIGKSGIESFSEIYLKGINGKRFVEADVTGRFSRALENESTIPGGKITLTIDSKIQKAAEDGLKEVINKIRNGEMKDRHDDVKGGSAIAVDVNTGEILALASYPNFDPGMFSKGITSLQWNQLNNDTLKPLFDRSLTGTYSPGSTFKMITALGALEEGQVTPDELIEDTGVYKYFDKYQPACWIWRQSHQTHGWVNVSSAIKVSCNVYFYEIGRRLGIDKIYEYATLFGLNSKTNIEISGESLSKVASKEGRKLLKKEWYPGDDLQAAIGQSDTSVTPIAMSSYISTLANGGKNYQLHVIKTQESYDGSQIFDSKSPIILNQVNIKPENLKAVFEGMKSVADEEGGTAYTTFKDFPIQIAGKTGSAQTGIVGQSAHAWFTGFAPYNDPKIAVIVLIENGGSGGYTAPVAKNIFSQYFGLQDSQQLPENSISPENSNNSIDIVRQVN